MKKIKIDNKGINYSDGISFLPYSLYINLLDPTDKEGTEIDIFELYNLIIDHGINDVIFMGGRPYYKELSWLIPKLLSEKIYCVNMTIIDSILPIPFNQNIIVTDFNGFFRRIEKYSYLKPTDVVILRTKSITELNKVKNLFLNSEIKAGLVYDATMLEHNDVINSNIYVVAPYNSILI